MVHKVLTNWARTVGGMEDKPLEKRASTKSAFGALIASVVLIGSSCGSSEVAEVAEVATTTNASVSTSEPVVPEQSDSDETADSSLFTVEIWADNWAAVYVDGELIGEDSVPITTERSFNSETFNFEATYPFTLAIEARTLKKLTRVSNTSVSKTNRWVMAV